MCDIDGKLTVNSMQKLAPNCQAVHKWRKRKKKKNKYGIIRLQNKKYRALILSCFISQGISTDCPFMPIILLTLPCRFNSAFCSKGGNNVFIQRRESGNWQYFEQVQKRGERARGKKKKEKGVLFPHCLQQWLIEKRLVRGDMASQRMQDGFRLREAEKF